MTYNILDHAVDMSEAHRYLIEFVEPPGIDNTFFKFFEEPTQEQLEEVLRAYVERMTPVAPGDP